MSLDQDWNAGGSALIPNTGKPGLRDILDPLHGLGSLTALKAILPDNRSSGQPARVTVGAARGKWRWHATSTLTGDDIMVVTPADAPTAGRWIREVGSYMNLALAIAFGTADAAILYMMPTGFELDLLSSAFEVTTSFTGGTDAAIGASSSQSGLSTKGDLLGGSGGDVLATLVSTGVKYKGTKGTKMGTPSARLVGGSTIRNDRIVDAFTAGVGIAHFAGNVLLTP